MEKEFKQAYINFLDNEIKSSKIRLANILCKHTEMDKKVALNTVEGIYKTLDKELEKMVSEYDFFNFSEACEYGK